MAYVAVDRNGIENIYKSEPHRAYDHWWDVDAEISLPKGTIEKLIGRDLDWNDEPVELKEE